MIKLVWAMDLNGVIGKNNGLPWNIKEELKHFVKITKNNTILMGRTTFEHLPGILPNRKIIVLTRNESLTSDNKDVKYCHNLNKLVDEYANNPNLDLYVCGGANIYKQFLPFANELIISIIKDKFDGDTYFPEYDLSKFKLTAKQENSNFIVEYYIRSGVKNSAT